MRRCLYVKEEKLSDLVDILNTNIKSSNLNIDNLRINVNKLRIHIGVINSLPYIYLCKYLDISDNITPSVLFYFDETEDLGYPNEIKEERNNYHTKYLIVNYGYELVSHIFYSLGYLGDIISNLDNKCIYISKISSLIEELKDLSISKEIQ